MSESSMKNTREHKRTPVSYETRIMFLRGQNTDTPRELTISGRIINHSKGGFCIFTPYYISQGDLLKACTDISSDSDFYFDVRWVEPHETGYLFGCNFADLSETMSIN